MRINFTILLVCLIFISAGSSFSARTMPVEKKKSVIGNGERQREYLSAVNALKDSVFLVSFYSFVDNAGKVEGIEPEGNFITVSKDKMMMHKSVSLHINTFSGSDQIKGKISDFILKESSKRNIQFSFVITDREKTLIFKGKMNNGDNMIEGSLRGKNEEREIFLSGNVQPVKSHFNY